MNKIYKLLLIILLFTPLYSKVGRKYEHVDTIDVLKQLWPDTHPDSITIFGNCSDTGAIDTIFSKAYMIHDSVGDSCYNILDAISAPGGTLFDAFYSESIYTNGFDTIPAEQPFFTTYSGYWNFLLDSANGNDADTVLFWLHSDTNRKSISFNMDNKWNDTLSFPDIPYIKFCDDTLFVHYLTSCGDTIYFGAPTLLDSGDVRWFELNKEAAESTYDTVLVTSDLCSDTIKIVNPYINFHFTDTSLFNIRHLNNHCDTSTISRDTLTITIGAGGGVVSDVDSMCVRYADTTLSDTCLNVNNDTLIIPTGGGSTYCLKEKSPLFIDTSDSCDTISLLFTGCLDTVNNSLTIDVDGKTILCGGSGLEVGEIDSTNITDNSVSFDNINTSAKESLLLDAYTGPDCADTTTSFMNIHGIVFDENTFSVINCGDGIFISATAVGTSSVGGSYTGSDPIYVSSNIIGLNYSDTFFDINSSHKLTWNHEFIEAIQNSNNSLATDKAPFNTNIVNRMVLKNSDPIGRGILIRSGNGKDTLIDSLYLKYNPVYFDTTTTGFLTIHDIDSHAIEDGGIDSTDLDGGLDSAIFAKWKYYDCNGYTHDIGVPYTIYIDKGKCSYNWLGGATHGLLLAPKINKTTISADSGLYIVDTTHATTCEAYDSLNYNIGILLGDSSGLYFDGNTLRTRVGAGLTIIGDGATHHGRIVANVSGPLSLDIYSLHGAITLAQHSIDTSYMTPEAIHILVDSNEIAIDTGINNGYWDGDTVNLSTTDNHLVPMMGLEFNRDQFIIRQTSSPPGGSGYLEVELDPSVLGGTSYHVENPIYFHGASIIALAYDSCFFETRHIGLYDALTTNGPRTEFVQISGYRYDGGGGYIDSNGVAVDTSKYSFNIHFDAPFHVSCDSLSDSCEATWFDTVTFAYNPAIFTLTSPDSLFTITNGSITDSMLSASAYDSICHYVTNEGCGGGSGTSDTMFVMFPEFSNMTIAPDPPSNGDLFTVIDNDFGGASINAYKWISYETGAQNIRMNINHDFVGINDSLHIMMRTKVDGSGGSVIQIISFSLYDVTTSSVISDTLLGSFSNNTSWTTDTIFAAKISLAHEYVLSATIKLISQNGNGVYIDQFKATY